MLAVFAAHFCIWLYKGSSPDNFIFFIMTFRLYCDQEKAFFNGLFSHLCIINHYVVILYASCGEKDLLPLGNTMKWRVNSLSFFNTRQHPPNPLRPLGFSL